MLLLTVAITAGCGSDSEWTPPGGVQAPVTLVAPEQYNSNLLAGASSGTIDLVCTNSAIDLKSDKAGATLARVDACGFTFTASTPGTYNVTVTAIRDRSKYFTFTFSVVPDLQIDGPNKFLYSEEKVEFKASGAGTAASIAATGSTLTWSFESEDGIGEISSNTNTKNGDFTPSGEIGTGTVTATLYDALTNDTYTATLDINVVEKLGVTKPDILADFFKFYDDDDGLWASRPKPNPGTGPGSYNTELDDYDIPENAYVYMAWYPATFSVLLPPGFAIDDYAGPADHGKTDVSDLKPGEWGTIRGTANFGFGDQPVDYVVIVTGWAE